MEKKVTLDTLEAILNEVDEASYNKSRVISDIQNRDVRQIIQDRSDYSLKHGNARLETATKLVVTGTAGGIAAGICGGAAGGGIAAGGAIAGGHAALTAATAGAVAGSAVPIAGTLIGAGVGLLIGGIIGRKKAEKKAAKEKQKREILYQEATSKQNGQISALTREVQSLQDKINKKDAEIARLKYQNDALNARLKYLAGVLSAYEGATAALAA